MISLTEEQQEILAGFVRRRQIPQWLSKRATIILHLNGGSSIKETARHLSLSRNTVRLWLRRWQEEADKLVSSGNEDDNDCPLSQRIKTVLSDAPRCGRPPTFSPEEIVQIVVIACETPEKFGRPISHWTTRELADEAVKQGIVKSVSPRSVGRFLKSIHSSAASQPLLASSQHRQRRSVPSANNRDLSSVPAGLNSPRCRQPSDQL